MRAAHDELRQLIRQRAEIMKRIGTVKQTIAGLANLFGDSVLNDELLELVDRKTGGRQPGFTKACRMILMEANRALGAREVCEQIQQRVPTLLMRHRIRWPRLPPSSIDWSSTGKLARFPGIMDAVPGSG